MGKNEKILKNLTVENKLKSQGSARTESEFLGLSGEMKKIMNFRIYRVGKIKAIQIRFS